MDTESLLDKVAQSLLASLLMALLAMFPHSGFDGGKPVFAAELDVPLYVEQSEMTWSSNVAAAPTRSTPASTQVTAVPTVTPTLRATTAPTSTATTMPTSTATTVPTSTATTVPTLTATGVPTFTPTAAGTPTPTLPPTSAATPTGSPAPTSTSTETPTPTSTLTGSPTATTTPSITPTKTAGSNDDIDAATSVDAFPFSGTQDTTTATSASDDPDMQAGGRNSNTVWFKLVAPSSGGVHANTFGSDYDTVLAAFTGSRGSLSLLTVNDDANGTYQSEIAFNVQSGTTYYIEVAQFGATHGGSLQLSVTIGGTIANTAVPTAIPTYAPTPTPWIAATLTPIAAGPAPANDSIRSATIVNSLPFSVILDTTGATSEYDDPIMGSGTAQNSNTVWFQLTISTAGTIRVSSAGTNYDTILAVFSGSPGSLTLVASNDDVSNSASSYDGTSLVNFAAAAGTTYFIEAAQYGAQGGGQLHISVDGTAGVGQNLPTVIPTMTPAVSGVGPVLPVSDRVARPVIRDGRFFQQTGYRVDTDAFWDFFVKRGGVRTFGYPVSWDFTLQGFRVQFFQRSLMQQMPGGGVAIMNLLDEGLMPYSQINFSTFPAPERELIDEAPSPSGAEYGARAIAFIEKYVPDEWEGMQVNFLKTFRSTVRYEDAFPNGDGNPGLVQLMSLELLGLPTSKPAYDPANHSFVYQRFQRGILHYDASSGATQGLLLADYLKSIITGQDLPADLGAAAKSSKFYLQYDPNKPGGLARPQQLTETNLLGAFTGDTP